MNSSARNRYGPDPIVSLICWNGSVFAICSGIMNGTEAPPRAIASMKIPIGRFNLIAIVRSSVAPKLSTYCQTVCPIVSRAAHRAKLGAQSRARTGSPLWNFNPSRSAIV